jgi:hypothetical protein
MRYLPLAATTIADSLNSSASPVPMATITPSRTSTVCRSMRFSSVIGITFASTKAMSASTTSCAAELTEAPPPHSAARWLARLPVGVFASIRPFPTGGYAKHQCRKSGRRGASTSGIEYIERSPGLKPGALAQTQTCSLTADLEAVSGFRSLARAAARDVTGRDQLDPKRIFTFVI